MVVLIYSSSILCIAALGTMVSASLSEVTGQLSANPLLQKLGELRSFSKMSQIGGWWIFLKISMHGLSRGSRVFLFFSLTLHSIYFAQDSRLGKRILRNARN